MDDRGWIPDWVFIISEAHQPVVQNRVQLILRRAIPPRPGRGDTSISGIIFGSSIDYRAFLVPWHAWATVGSFDENMQSLRATSLCLECADWMWRAQRMGFLRRQVRSPSVYPSWFEATPRWFQPDADYAMMKWGHFFEYELQLSAPPSGYLLPFNSPQLSLSEVIPVDVRRRSCIEKNESVAENRWCCFDIVATLLNHRRVKSKSLVALDYVHSAVHSRFSIWITTTRAPQSWAMLGTPVHEDLNAVEWVLNISQSLRRSKTAPLMDIVPVVVSLLFLDCQFQRAMLGSLVVVPVHRLIIAWNGNDSCAEENVVMLRKYLPVDQLAVVHFEYNMGYGEAFNAGARLAMSEASKYDADLPQWYLISNADIKYDERLIEHVRLNNKATSNSSSDIAFFFGVGLSFCTVSVTHQCFERVGFMDPNFYPAYSEDIDFLWRAHLTGLLRSHDNSYNFWHYNGGTWATNNSALLSEQYLSLNARGSTTDYRIAKWAVGAKDNVWWYYPVSGWVNPFNSSILPAWYTPQDNQKRTCTIFNTGIKYVNSSVCWVNGSTWMVEFPDAALPLHLMEPITLDPTEYIRNWTAKFSVGNR